MLGEQCWTTSQMLLHHPKLRLRAQASGDDLWVGSKLGEKLGIKTGDWTRVTSARGEVVVKAVVTRRMQSLRITGQDVTIVWMPYNWGFKGLSRGASVNVLTIDAADPGAGTQETKACLVQVERASDAAIQEAVASFGPPRRGRR